jgi:hypothetical protein
MAGLSTATIKLILHDGTQTVTIAETASYNVDAAGNMQNGEVNFDVWAVIGDFAKIYASGYFTQIVQVSSTGVALSGVNQKYTLGDFNVSTAKLKLQVTFSHADDTRVVLETCRLDGTPVTQHTPYILTP